MKTETKTRNQDRSISIRYILAAALIAMLCGWGACRLLSSLLFQVQVAIDGSKEPVQQYLLPVTVGEVLTRQGIVTAPYDTIEPSLETELSEDTLITITRSVEIHVSADGSNTTLITSPITQRDAVRLAGVELGERDFIEGETIFPVVDGQTIHVVRVTERYEQQHHEIPFETQYRRDENLEKGFSRTIQNGINGQTVDTVVVTCYDGEEAYRRTVASETIQQTQPRIVAEGVLTSVSRGGNRISFNKAYQMTTTAYTYTGNNTASGRPPAVGLVAVDPSVIPLGTRLYIDGYGYATAADTGGAIKGNRIDLFFETTSECMNWGRRSVKVYVLD